MSEKDFKPEEEETEANATNAALVEEEEVVEENIEDQVVGADGPKKEDESVDVSVAASPLPPPPPPSTGPRMPSMGGSETMPPGARVAPPMPSGRRAPTGTSVPPGTPMPASAPQAGQQPFQRPPGAPQAGQQAFQRPPTATMPGQTPTPPPGAYAQQGVPQPAGAPMPMGAQAGPPPQGFPGQHTQIGPVPQQGGGNAFALVMANLWHIPNDIWRGGVDHAFERPRQAVREAGNPALSWLIPLALNTILVGLLAAAFVHAGMSAYFFFYSPSFGDYVQLFAMVTLAMFALLMLRALAIMLASRVSGSTASFPEAATDLAVAQSIWWLPLAIAALLVLIMPSTPLMYIIITGIYGVALMAEILSYIAVTRTGPHVRSPLVPYAWFTIVAVIVFMLLMYLYARSL